MTTPLITIGITACNAADSIARAIASALAQGHRPIEIVVVDDASSDATAAVVAGLAAAHSEIRLMVNEVNSGVAAARNRVIAEARGEFVAFFDDDDSSDPRRCALQLARILAYEAEFAGGAPVVCHTARLQNYPDGTRRIEAAMGEAIGRAAPSGPRVARRILTGDPLAEGHGSCATCSQMARASVYRSLPPFDPVFRRAEDTDFAIRLAKAGGHFPGIAEPLVTQTMTRTSDKSLDDEKRWSLALIDKHRDVFLSEGEQTFCRDWVELRYAWLGARRGEFARRLARLAARHPARTWQRLRLALPNLGGNRALGRFLRGAAS